MGWLGASAAAAPSPRQIALEQELAAAPAADKTGVLIALSKEAETSDLVRAAALAQEARTSATTELERLRAEVRIAMLERRRGDYPGALARAKAGALAASAVEAKAEEAQFLNVIGRAHWSLTQYPAALEAYQEQLRLAEALDDRAQIFDAHTGLGMVQMDTSNHALAEKHFEITRALAEALGDLERRAIAATELGLATKARKDYTRAQAFLTEAMRLNQELGAPRGIADACVNLGALADTAGDPAGALARYEEALATYQNLGLTRQQSNVRRLMGTAWRKLGELEKSRESLEQARALAEPLKSPIILARAHRELALTHEARGDFRAALAAERAMAANNEVALNEKTRQSLAELQTRYDVERHAHEIALLRRDQTAQAAELRSVRVTRTAGACVAGVVVLAAGGLIATQRARLRTRRQALEVMQAAKSAAEEAHALKSRLLRIASHDLKNPLGAILGGLDYLQADAAMSPDLVAFTGDLKSEGERMLQLIRDLLDHSALELGRFTLVRKPLDLVALVRRVSRVTEPAARRKQQSIVVRSEGDVLLVDGDEARLWQVIENLLSNALKFTPPGRPIEVTLRCDDHVASCAVRDQGPGIKPEEVAQLFLPFSKASARPTGGESSSGLGLSLVRELIELHDGRVWVESPPGEGATFIFTVPLEVSPPAETVSAEEAVAFN